MQPVASGNFKYDLGTKDAQVYLKLCPLPLAHSPHNQLPTGWTGQCQELQTDHISNRKRHLLPPPRHPPTVHLREQQLPIVQASDFRVSLDPRFPSSPLYTQSSDPVYPAFWICPFLSHCPNHSPGSLTAPPLSPSSFIIHPPHGSHNGPLIKKKKILITSLPLNASRGSGLWVKHGTMCRYTHIQMYVSYIAYVFYFSFKTSTVVLKRKPNSCLRVLHNLTPLHLTHFPLPLPAPATWNASQCPEYISFSEFQTFAHAFLSAWNILFLFKTSLLRHDWH